MRQEICPKALRWAAKYRGWIVREQKTPPLPKKTHQKGWDLGKMCLIALLLKGTARMECVPRVTA